MSHAKIGEYINNLKKSISERMGLIGVVLKKGGSMNWLVLFIILFVIVIPAVTGIHEERVALATDIQTGKLIETSKSKEMIIKGDEFLKDAGRKVANEKWSNRSFEMYEGDLFRAFIAKVWFERARLEMELE